MKPWQLIAALLLSLPLHAKSLGVIAPRFDIIEIDMLDWINALPRNGRNGAMEARFKEQVTQSVKRPPPVVGITVLSQTLIL